MIRARIWWGVVIAVTLLLAAVVLALPAVALLLPQYQGDAPTVPPELKIRQALLLIAPSVAVAALAMLVVLIVAAVLRWPVAAPAPLRKEPVGDDVVEGELIEQGWDQRD